MARDLPVMGVGDVSDDEIAAHVELDACEVEGAREAVRELPDDEIDAHVEASLAA